MALTCCSAPDTDAQAARPTSRLDVAGFGRVSIYEPRSTPTQVVLFISGDGGWNRGVVSMAEMLRDHGALVAGIDIRTFVRTMDAAHGCAYPAGDLERLSRTVQLSRRLAVYKAPILVGYSSGATLAYAALAAAPLETFAGAISLGFCPDLLIRRAPCEQNGLTATKRTGGAGYTLHSNPHLRKPWMVLQGDVDQVCSANATRTFVSVAPAARLYTLPQVGHGFAVPEHWESPYLAAFDAIAANQYASDRDTASTPPASDVPAGPKGPALQPTGTALRPKDSDVQDLSLIEVAAAPSPGRDTMAIVLTGDGGWAELDRRVAEGLAQRGIPSVGWSSLRYYWTPRTPDAAAADLARIIDHYERQWGTSRVMLVGYSFGADVLPFLVNRLPGPVRAHVVSVDLLGLSNTAAFEFHVSDWVRSRSPSGNRTVPEVERLDVPVLCVSGADETDSACGLIHGPLISVRHIGRGHHFGGDYARLADAIAAAARPQPKCASGPPCTLSRRDPLDITKAPRVVEQRLLRSAETCEHLEATEIRRPAVEYSRAEIPGASTLATSSEDSSSNDRSRGLPMVRV